MPKSSSMGPWGLAFLRVVVGIVFLAHGWQKISTMGLHGTTEMFTKVGIPLPLISAGFVIAVEFLAGIALILGLGARWASLLLAIDMLGAIYFVHLKNGLFSNHGGYEFALSLLAACVALALSGGGAVALDNAI